MKINRDNYEAYFIDYLEGNLGEDLVDDFIEFLQINPDLKEELSLFESVTAEAENVVFQQKEKLYKEKFDSEKEFDHAAIANLEGDISEIEKKEFEAYISKHPEKQKEIKLFSYTKFQFDESIKFQNKKNLYHHSVGRTVLLWATRVAAVLIVAMAIFWLSNESSDKFTPQNQLAEVKDNTPDKEEATEKTPPSNEVNVPLRKEDPPKTKEKTQKETPKTLKSVPKETVKPRETKSLRETTKGRMGGEDIALLRIPVEVPNKISPRTVTFAAQNNSLALAAMPEIHVPKSKDPFEERLLADVVKEKTGLDHLSLNKITKAGLQLVSNISKDKFSYETNNEGKVTEVNLDTRLLAFSIPTKNEESGE
jgi:hypothetical protein